MLETGRALRITFDGHLAQVPLQRGVRSLRGASSPALRWGWQGWTPLWAADQGKISPPWSSFCILLPLVDDSHP